MRAGCCTVGMTFAMRMLLVGAVAQYRLGVMLICFGSNGRADVPISSVLTHVPHKANIAAVFAPPS